MKKTVFYFLSIFLISFTIQSLYAQEENTTEGNTYALLIAIDAYQGDKWETLKTSVNDANKIKDLLTEKYDFDEILTLYNEAASRATIIDFLGKVTANVKPEDKILIFFSGHGTMMENEGYWVPSDAVTEDAKELIANTTIKNLLNKTKCKHALLLVDSYFGGASFKYSNLTVKNTGEKNYYEVIDDLVSRQAIATGGVKPTADGSGEHSVFVKYLLKFLEKNNKPQLSIDQLYNLIRFPVAANSSNMPLIGHIQDTGHEGGQFIFELKKAKVCELKVKFKEGNNITFGQDGGTLNALVDDVSKVSFEWLKGTSPIGDNTTSLKVTESGTYTVLISDGEGCNDAAIIDVNVELPQIYVSIEEGSQVQYTFRGMLHALASRKGVNFEWRRNGFLVGNETVLEVTQSGTYTVTAKTKDGRIVSTAKTDVIIKDRTYVVKIGDNLERIARKFYGDPSKISLLYSANASKIPENRVLKIGQELIIPANAKEDNSNKIIQLVANRAFAPLSALGLYQDGMLTDMVKQTFQKFSDEISIDFMDLDKAQKESLNGRYTASFPVTKSRQGTNSFLYSAPIYNVLNVFFTKIDSKIEYKKDKNLKGLKVCMVRGYSDNKITQLIEDRIVRVFPCNSPSHGFELLQAGTVDLLVLPQIVGLATLTSSNKHNEQDFMMLSKEISTISLHLAISNKHPQGLALIGKFNNAFQELKASGIIDKIQDKHLDLFQSDRP